LHSSYLKVHIKVLKRK